MTIIKSVYGSGSKMALTQVLANGASASAAKLLSPATPNNTQTFVELSCSRATVNLGTLANVDAPERPDPP